MASEDALAASLKGNKLVSDKSCLQLHDLSGGKVPICAVHPPRYDITTHKQDFLAYLNKHGYAVVSGVARPEQIEHCKSLMWDYLESIPNTQVKRDDIKTWGIPGDWLPSETNGILHGFGFGQCDFMWYLRLLPEVRSVFSAIWETDDLLVSFDGGNVFRPWKYNREWLTDGGWYHVDQNGTKADSIGRVCVQGLVTLTDVTEDSGGLVVIPGSHLKHTEMCKRSKVAKSMGDFVPVPVDDEILKDGAKLICAQAGDLILWDSRTVHCNTPALTALLGADATNLNGDRIASSDQPWRLIRQVGYVCMTPAKMASVEILEKRKDAFVNNISTSHWPHKFVRGGFALPDAVANDPTKIPREQRALIGYDREDARRARRLCTVQ